MSFPLGAGSKSVRTITINLSIDDRAFKNSTIRISSLVLTNKLLVFVVTPVLTTVSELDVTLDSLVSIPGTSVNGTVFVVKSALTCKSVSFPLALVSVTVLVLAFTVTIWLSLKELSLVVITRLEHLFSVSGSKTVFPITVVVTTLLVCKLALTVVEVVLKATFIEITIVFPALASTIALSTLEFGFSNISIFVSHFTPSGHTTVKELTNIGLLVLSFLESVGTLAVESVILHLTNVLVTLKFT